MSSLPPSAYNSASEVTNITFTLCGAMAHHSFTGLTSTPTLNWKRWNSLNITP